MQHRERKRERERERMVSLSRSFVFSSPPLFGTAMPLAILLFMAYLCVSEIRGKHLQYSKFWNTSSQTSRATRIELPSRTGMLLLYTPAFLAGLLSFGLYNNDDFRFVMVYSAVTIHFFKRVIEVLFVHKYSGGMVLDSVIIISLSYLSGAASLIYAQHLVQGFPEPPIDLLYPGIVLFLLSISGNFYHHYILSKLRKKGDKGYKIPRGGLFNLVICPHYLSEILVFVGIAFISQTLYSFTVAIGVALYLSARSHVNRKWYLSKFENFPKEVKALIPYVF